MSIEEVVSNFHEYNLTKAKEFFGDRLFVTEFNSIVGRKKDTNVTFLIVTNIGVKNEN